MAPTQLLHWLVLLGATLACALQGPSASVQPQQQLQQRRQPAKVDQVDRVAQAANFSQANRSRPFMYLHVHKSAGSTVCERARLAGEIFDPTEMWCASSYYHDWDYPAQFAVSPQYYRRNISCASRAARFVELNVSWNSIEHELCAQDLCFDDFTYGTVLRGTVERIESHINYQGPFDVEGLLQCLESRNATASPCTLNGSPGRLWITFDNYLVRTFAGNCSVVNSPIGSVTEADLQRAIQNLEKFDFVVPLSNLTSPRAQALFTRSLGWHVTPTDKARIRQHRIVLSESQRQRFLQINHLDTQLTNHFFKRWNLPLDGVVTEFHTPRALYCFDACFADAKARELTGFDFDVKLLALPCKSGCPTVQTISDEEMGPRLNKRINEQTLRQRLLGETRFVKEEMIPNLARHVKGGEVKIAPLSEERTQAAIQQVHDLIQVVKQEL